MTRIITLAAVLSFAATATAQSPHDAVIVFYRLPPIEVPKGQSDQAVESGGVDKVVRGIRRIFDRIEPVDPAQDPTIYQVSVAGATRLVTLAKGEFFELPVRAGNYGFSWTGGPSRGQLTVVSVNAGQQAFVQVQFRRITEVKAEAAAAEIKDLHPISRARVFDSAVRIPDRPPLPEPASRKPEDAQAPVQVAATNEATPASAPAQTQVVKPKRTLPSIQQAYLNQSIIVRGSVIQGTLTDWKRARAERNSYKPETSRPMPEKYRGQVAKVLSVQIAEAIPRDRTSNALGEPVSEAEIVDPAIDLVAQFSDGTLGVTSARFEFLADRARLVSEQQQREADMAKNLPLIVGKPLYATGLTVLYEPDTTMEELTGQREILKRLSAARIPLFDPLQILAAKYMPAEDAVVFRLKLPNNSQALSFTSRSFLDEASQDFPFIERVSGSLLTAIPKELTAKEIEAVKQGELFQGMSGRAVSYTFGQAESENVWGTNGGKQRIYLKTISIHFDNKDNVVEWQMLVTK